LNKNSIIFRLIFELGCPVFVIAKTLKTSEAEIYRFLNGEKVPREAEARLKRLCMDLVGMGENWKNTKGLYDQKPVCKA
jgi:hypothetical protein